MRYFVKKNAVVSLQIKEDLFTLGQWVCDRAFMRFYKISNTTGKWDSINLNQVESLFCVMVLSDVIRDLAIRKVPLNEVIPSDLSFERYFIDPHPDFEGYRLHKTFPQKGGKLVDTGENGQTDAWCAPVIIQNLDHTVHEDLIRKHELSTLNSKYLISPRLIHFFETGVDRNTHKEALFPELFANDNGSDKNNETYKIMRRTSMSLKEIEEEKENRANQ
jgi:hypothetical protein